jgi:hypothetical protein
MKYKSRKGKIFYCRENAMKEECGSKLLAMCSEAGKKSFACVGHNGKNML